MGGVEGLFPNQALISPFVSPTQDGVDA